MDVAAPGCFPTYSIFNIIFIMRLNEAAERNDFSSSPAPQVVGTAVTLIN
jgi:hypothetical protein